MLSGFILSYVYLSKRINWRKFHIARFARIAPLHFATTAVVGVLVLFGTSRGLAYSENYQLWHISSQLFMVHSYPYIGMAWPWNFPSWSISVEYFCYLFLFPITFFAHKHLIIRSLLLPTVLIIVLCGVNVYQLTHLQLTGETESWSAIIRGICSFITGYLIYLIATKSPFIMKRCVRAAPWFVLATLVALFLLHRFGLSEWYLLLTFPTLVLSFSKDGDTVVHRFLASKPLNYLGLISYSVYLWHGILSKISNSFFDEFQFNNTPVGFIMYLLIIAVALATGAISYHLIEIPSKNFVLKVTAKS